MLGPYIFLLIGIGIGFATTYLFKNPLRIAPNVVLGIAGSFFGMWVWDIFDLRFGSNLQGVMLAASIGAIVSTVGLNLLWNRLRD